MVQRCRWCVNIVTGNGTYCTWKNRELSDEYAKNTNKCNGFEYCEIDAFDMAKKRKERAAKEQEQTDDNQTSLF